MKNMLVLVLAAAFCSCSNAPDNAIPSDPIRLSVLPDQAPDRLLRRYTPLIEYLEGTTNLDLELVMPGSYQLLLDQFDNGYADITWFGGLTFVQAEFRSGAEPLVMRDVDRHFSSCYLVKSSDTRTSLDQFRGEVFSFGPELSTSGHLMPRHFMIEMGLIPEHVFKSIRHTSGHDHTAVLVRDDKEVAIGVANCIIVQSMFDDGRLKAGEIRILETTPSYSNYVFGVRASLDENVKLLLRDAFLALDAGDAKQLELLKSLGANAYFPAGAADFDGIRSAAKKLDLLVAENQT